MYEYILEDVVREREAKRVESISLRRSTESRELFLKSMIDYSSERADQSARRFTFQTKICLGRSIEGGTQGRCSRSLLLGKLGC